MEHCVDLSKEIQGIKPKLTKRFWFVFLLWSLLFPVCALLVFSVCICIQLHANWSRGFLSKKGVDDQPAFMPELDGNILLSYLSFARSRSSLLTKCQNAACKITSGMYMGVQDCKQAKEKSLPLMAAGGFSREAEAVKTAT